MECDLSPDQQLPFQTHDIVTIHTGQFGINMAQYLYPELSEPRGFDF